MLRGRTAAIAAALAIAAAAVVTAGCGGGSTSQALSLDPVAAAATKTQNAGAARVNFAIALRSSQLQQGKTLRLRGAGVIDGTSGQLTFALPAGIVPQLGGSSMKEIFLEQNGDYTVYVRAGALASYLPGGKQWVKLDVSKLGSAAGVDLGKLLSGSQLQPTDVLAMLRSEGATIRKVGPATIDGAATTHYHVTVDMAKALHAKGLTSPLLASAAAQLPKVPEDVWIGKDGLVRRVRLSYGLTQNGKRAHVDMTMNLSDYGTHVTIAAPPESDVFDVTQFAQSGLGSAMLHS